MSPLVCFLCTKTHEPGVRCREEDVDRRLAKIGIFRVHRIEGRFNYIEGLRKRLAAGPCMSPCPSSFCLCARQLQSAAKIGLAP